MRTRIIHYCWFGGNPKPQIVQKCMESWRKYCPDWEIREWNESNFDVSCCDYVREAYEAKKWAFVSDYCRFEILSRYGGVYLDTDVELIRPIDDLPVTFAGFERDHSVASGLIRGAAIGDALCTEMLQLYRESHFRLPDGSLDMTTVCERETAMLKRHGLVCDGSMQTVGDTVIYPKEYFCPTDFATGKLVLTGNTYSIHHYAASWITPWARFKRGIKELIGTPVYMKLHLLKKKLRGGGENRGQ